MTHLNRKDYIYRLFLFLPVLLWLLVALFSIWMFLDMSFSEVSNTTNDLDITWLDKLFPLFFLLGVPVSLWFAYKDYCEASLQLTYSKKDNVSEKDLKLAKLNNEQVPHSLNEDQRNSIISILSDLRNAGVITDGEIDDSEFLDLPGLAQIQEGSLYDVSWLLGEYQREHNVVYKNLAIFEDQIEVIDGDICNMAEIFTHLADTSFEINHLKVEMLSTKPREQRGRIHYQLNGERGSLDFDYHMKNVSGSLMRELSELLNPDPSFAYSYFDSVFLVTRLSDIEMEKFNSLQEYDYERFERIT